MLNFQVACAQKFQTKNDLFLRCQQIQNVVIWKESISKEMNNDNDLKLHSMTKLSDWLRYYATVSTCIN